MKNTKHINEEDGRAINISHEKMLEYIRKGKKLSKENNKEYFLITRDGDVILSEDIIGTDTILYTFVKGKFF